jgi:hypothetical protein
MATTLEALEQRVQALENRLAAMAPPATSTNGLDIPIFREADRQQAAVTKAAETAFKKMGIDVQPVGAEKLQEMMIAAGIRPEENIASREIIAMREEKGQRE